MAWSQDADGDGFTMEEGDCDDADPSVHPYATELCAGGVDENCNGIVDETHSWYLMGSFLIGEQWENIGGVGVGIVSGEQMASGFGIAEGESFAGAVIVADCANRVEVLFDGIAITCFEGDESRDDAFLYGCTARDTGAASVRVNAYDALDNAVGGSSVIFYGVDVVPSDLRIAGPTTLVQGEEGCWRPQVETGEPLDIVEIQAPNGVRIMDDRTGGDTLCWTPLQADVGEHRISLDVDDYEGNLLSGERSVSVAAAASHAACGCRHPAPAPGLQFALAILIAAFGRRPGVRRGTTSCSGISVRARVRSIVASVAPIVLVGAAFAPDVARGQDADGDGYTTEERDCDDGDPSVHPYAIELCAGGVDENCNGIVDEPLSWWPVGRFLVGDTWERFYDAPPTADQFALGLGIEEMYSDFYAVVQYGDCVERVEVTWEGTGIGFGSYFSDRHVEWYGGGSFDAGSLLVRADAYDFTGALLDSATVTFYAFDVVPEGVLGGGEYTAMLGVESCWEPWVASGEALEIVEFRGPTGARVVRDWRWGDSICWTPERRDRGEHTIAFEVDDHEGNTFTSEFFVRVTSDRSCGCGHPAPANGWEILAVLAFALGVSRRREGGAP